jgi:hypothetical protein
MPIIPESPALLFKKRYYVTPLGWDNTNSWSAIPDGPTGATLPDQTSTAYFYKTGSGTCDFTSSINIGGLVMVPPYDGTVNQNGYDATIGLDGIYSTHGVFEGEGSMWVTGPIALYGSGFKCPDKLHIYGQTIFSSNFNVTDGTVTAYGGSTIIGDNTYLPLLEIQDNSSLPTHIDGTFSVRQVHLISGTLFRDSGIIHLVGNMTCDATFGSLDSRNDAVITVDGTTNQKIESFGIIPGIVINKTDSTPVMFSGGNPIRINGDFILQDGTVNMNGYNLQVGL